jgi:hypothetical protein
VAWEAFSIPYDLAGLDFECNIAHPAPKDTNFDAASVGAGHPADHLTGHPGKHSARGRCQNFPAGRPTLSSYCDEARNQAIQGAKLQLQGGRETRGAGSTC